MSGGVHHTAIVDPDAHLDHDVTIGPYCIIGPRVALGARTTLASHVVLERNTRLGENCSVGIGSVLGGEPQDRKFKSEETWLDVGDGTRIRDYCTINRGTAACGKTSVGCGCYIMSYVHIAHDCVIEDGVVLANAVQLAGHVHVEAHAAVGGSTPVHQFVRIGTHAFVGGGSRLPQDVPPYSRAAGNPFRLYGINTIGLTRAGFSPEVRLALKHAYRLLFNSDMTMAQAIDRLREEAAEVPEVLRLVEFVAHSERGVLV
ncbi:MAG: acyl-ACP--UDP-N-acetylglucosamine O-acyltransferase [Gemmatimonadota bacterium]|nr:MAG: acyl-ACP--UDP-N-acetylglucosamine O-acyltransferase [Gemmatimonadota bacterium]